MKKESLILIYGKVNLVEKDSIFGYRRVLSLPLLLEYEHRARIQIATKNQGNAAQKPKRTNFLHQRNYLAQLGEWLPLPTIWNNRHSAYQILWRASKGVQQLHPDSLSAWAQR